MQSVFYDKATGRIRFVSDIPEGLTILVDPDAIATQASHYVDLSGAEPEIKPIEAMDTTHTVEGLVAEFPYIPTDTSVETAVGAIRSDEGGVILEFDAPGTYEIQFYPPPQYRDEVLEVTVG